MSSRELHAAGAQADVVVLEDFRSILAALRTQGIADPMGVYREIRQAVRGFLASLPHRDHARDAATASEATMRALRKVAAPGGVARAIESGAIGGPASDRYATLALVGEPAE